MSSILTSGHWLDFLEISKERKEEVSGAEDVGVGRDPTHDGWPEGQKMWVWVGIPPMMGGLRVLATFFLLEVVPG